MKILFWSIVAVDVVALAITGLLGLAAAGPSRTNPLAALVIPFFVPGAILLGAIWLFVSSQAAAARTFALTIAALPLIVVVVSHFATGAKLAPYRAADGTLTQFQAGALRDIEAAIARNDAAAVTAAAQGVDLDTPSLSGATMLVFALRKLDKSPDPLDPLAVLRALLAAGADPYVGGNEVPLQVAIGASRTAGIEPVRLLLDAGADPNARTEFGEPAFFTAGGTDIDASLMALLIEHDADLQLRGRDNQSAVWLPATVGNWSVLSLLLKSGAPWRDQQNLNGQSLRDYVESRADAGHGVAEVIAFMRAADADGGR